MIRVIVRHDLTKKRTLKKTHTNTKTKKKTMAKTNKLKKHIQRVVLETCDF